MVKSSGVAKINPVADLIRFLETRLMVYEGMDLDTRTLAEIEYAANAYIDEFYEGLPLGKFHGNYIIFRAHVEEEEDGDVMVFLDRIKRNDKVKG